MGEVIGDILPYAVAIAANPLLIIAIVLILLGDRARTSSLGFLLGWYTGIVALFTALTLLSSLLPTREEQGASVIEGIVQIVVGLLLLTLAAFQFRGRLRQGDDPALPRWMSTMSEARFGAALRLGFLIAAVNPKHMAFMAAPTVELAAVDLATDAVIVTVLVFALVASATAIIPVVAYLAASARLRSPLQALHGWLVRENKAVMAVLFLVLGANAVGNGIGAIWP